VSVATGRWASFKVSSFTLAREAGTEIPLKMKQTAVPILINFNLKLGRPKLPFWGQKLKAGAVKIAALLMKKFLGRNQHFMGIFFPPFLFGNVMREV
jgi:hypothetical protein